jgi:UDP-N-acetylmuramate: L-alanyl-gamma-D-glutamyl-meso-diaminopimelate ligase
MKVHLIAIGGSAMHNLAIALWEKGYTVSGSDDEIFEPSKSRLAKRDLLPEVMGWDASRIHEGIDAVIVGMHARADNPELLRAQELGLKIYSYPEYIFEQTKDKKRIVIGGSHGKTTITSMLLHVFNQSKIPCDFMVGAQLAGFDCMVKLTDDAEYVILEGDEYLSSPIDLRPKFHLYKPHIALISGIAWDHINVFPTFQNYVHQFDVFIDCIEPNGALIFAHEDLEVARLAAKPRHRPLTTLGYGSHPNQVENGITYLETPSGLLPIRVFGHHNLQNLNGAMQISRMVGIADSDFYSAIATFEGASKRLEIVARRNQGIIFKDFAHSPSKLKATSSAVKRQFPQHRIVACMELHTFSSLNATFLEQYAHSMDEPDIAIVYFNPHTIEHKRLEPITVADVKNAFQREDLIVLTDAGLVDMILMETDWERTHLLWMTSGNFDGLDISELALRLPMN